MAENHLTGQVIGVACDGTGYGSDGAIWGGEVLACDYATFDRQFHVRYVPMAGGDMAARQPWRMAVAWLHEAGLSWERQPPPGFGVIQQMIAKSVQTVLTSSCGRLFDAVSAILGVCLDNRYEAEAAMELESISGDDARPYGFDLEESEIDLRQTIRDIVASQRSGDSVSTIASRFHSTMAAAITAACRKVRKASGGLNRVCLSGGSFQNRRLLEGTADQLGAAGFEVYLHAEIPPNDGGISLGQAVIADAYLD
jgi:hydrogenase maturation protein HypF